MNKKLLRALTIILFATILTLLTFLPSVAALVPSASSEPHAQVALLPLPTGAINPRPDAAQSDPVDQCAFGTLRFLAGQTIEAQELLEAGFETLKTTPSTDQNALGRCALYLGMVRHTMREWNGALQAYHLARDIFRDIGDQQLEWTALFGINSIYLVQGRSDEALQSLRDEALPLTQEQSTQEWAFTNAKQLAAAATLNNIGLAQGVLNTEAVTLNDFGIAQASLKIPKLPHNSNNDLNYEQARASFEQALTIMQEFGAQSGEQTTPVELLFHILTSEYELSSEYDLFLKMNLAAFIDKKNKGTYEYKLELLLSLLKNISQAGTEPPEATALLEKWEELLLESMFQYSSHSFESTVLNNIGQTYHFQGQYDKALDYFEQAQEKRSNVSRQSGVIGVPNNIFDLYNNYIVRNNIGLVYYAQGRKTEALDSFKQALGIMPDKLDYRPTTAVILINIGIIYHEQGELDKALEHYEQAMEILERERTVADSRLVSITSRGELGSFNFLALNGSLTQYVDLYSLIVGLYHQQGQDKAAFYVAERSRARLFLDLLASGQVQLSDAESKLLTAERQAYTALQTAQVALTQAHVLEPLDAQRIANLEVQQAEANETHAAMLAQIEAQSEQLAALVPSSSLDYVLDLADVQHLLDEQTTLVSYYIYNQDEAVAFVITQDEFTAITLPVDRSALVETITFFHHFATLDDPHPESMQRLYEWLIAPLEPYLNTPGLIIVPHNELHYLPFAALTDGEQYLVDKYVLSTLPSASVLPFIQEKRKPDAKGVLALGNPITAEPLPSLNNASQEASVIADLYESQALVGAAATEGAVWSQAGQASILHLAAHGTYNKSNPLFSTLHLTSDEEYDGRLEVHEIYGLDLTATDLVVLSACQTNVGEVSAGDEVVAFNRAFLYAGTPSVIASLWNVDDAATTVLMERFYTHLSNGMSKAEALRQAQIDTRAEYPHPYYWAAFVLTGDGGTGTNFVSNEEISSAITSIKTIIPAYQPNATVKATLLLIIAATCALLIKLQIFLKSSRASNKMRYRKARLIENENGTNAKTA